MTKPATRRRKVEMPSGIRKKFTAALSMLLVAAVLMVGSTYAWFTLSTAPEVKGITTSIGANGNLEIALLNASSYSSTANDLGIPTNVGDSMEVKDVKLANVTWGNLVDLGLQNNVDNYGLSEVVLMPAALNVDLTNYTNGDPYVVDDEVLLKLADYGNDGRVKTVTQNTVLGLYDSGVFKQQDTAFAGVRGIGVSAGVTPRQLSYRSAVNAANAARAEANGDIRTSLTDKGTELGLLLVKVSRAGDTTVFTAADIGVIEDIIDDIEAANAKVLTGIRQSALAYVLSAANTTDLTDAQVQDAVTAFGTVAANDIVTTAATYGATLPATFSAAVTQYNTTETDIANARAKYALIEPTTPGGSEYAFNQELKNAIDAVVNRSNIEVNGKVPVGLTEQDKTDLGNEIINNKRANIALNSGSGLYDDIAKSVGGTSATVTMDVNQSGLTVTDVVTTFTVTPSTPYTLVAAYNSANDAGAHTGTGGGTAFAVTPYGYALDFGVRTNAPDGTTLRLTAAKQRVYNVDGNESANVQTQGEGSTFTFTATSAFGTAKVASLMDALRVVFTTPMADGLEILAVAKAGATTINGNEVTAPLVLTNFHFANVDGEAPELVIDSVKTGNGSLDLTTLNKSVAKKINVIVYLDGDIVDNTMVANAETSMSGKLNLQFETDADLIPMENAALRGESVVHHTKQEVTDLYATLTGAAGYSDALEAAYVAKQAGTASDAQNAAIQLDLAVTAVANGTTTSATQIDSVYTAVSNALTAWQAAHS